MTKPIQENVQSIPIKEIQPFRNHPFTVADNEDMAKIVESIGKVGTITPLLARPLPDGGYELISGHRRLRATGISTLNATMCSLPTFSTNG